MAKTPAPTPIAELEWIKLKEELATFDEEEPVIEKTKRLISQHPMIPLGILATCGSLILGFRAMIKGDQKQSNIMMRYRVFFQALTIAAITISSVTILKTREQSTKESTEDST